MKRCAGGGLNGMEWDGKRWWYSPVEIRLMFKASFIIIIIIFILKRGEIIIKFNFDIRLNIIYYS